jgi:hypothetical protein
MSIEMPVSKLIDLFGQDVIIKRKSFTVDDEGVITDDSYSATVSTKAWVLTVRGYREIWDYLPGYRVEGDFSAIFKASEAISVNDRVILPGAIETEIREIIPHYYRNNIDFYEAMLVRVGGEESV